MPQVLTHGLLSCSCISCHAAGFTDGPAKTRPTDCECAERHYFGLNELGHATCYQCPEGALCTDAKCFAESTAEPCRFQGPMTGNWSRDGELAYVLTSCDEGYMLINSTMQTAQGTFSNGSVATPTCTA